MPKFVKGVCDFGILISNIFVSVFTRCSHTLLQSHNQITYLPQRNTDCFQYFFLCVGRALLCFADAYFDNTKLAFRIGRRKI